MSELTPGTTVRILVRAGLVEHAEARSFVAMAEPGTEGVYDCPHPNRNMTGWHMVMVDHPDFQHVLYAPLHEAQMEALD
jgi:hypothetical protein